MRDRYDHEIDMIEGMKMLDEISDWINSLPPPKEVTAINLSVNADKLNKHQTKDEK